MSTTDDEFLRQLRATFKVEAAEHLQVIAAGLLKLDDISAPAAQREIVETVFRAAHSLKGASRAVELTAVESLCQSLEDVFASWRRQQSSPPLDALDTLHRTLDAITTLLAFPERTGAGHTASGLPELRKSLRQLGTSGQELATRTSPAAAPARFEFTSAETSADHVSPAATTKENAVPPETVRVAVPKLELRILEAEEMVTAKLAARQRVVDLDELVDRFGAWRTAWAEIESDARELRNAHTAAIPSDGRRSSGLIRLLDFFDANLDTLKALENQTASFGKAAERDRYAVGKLVDDMLEDSKKLLLLPFATISASLPKLVRDLCRDRGKMAQLTIHGENVEIDKRILEEMKDPLIHLLRNSIDHGIESPEERAQRGKPAQAMITLALSRVDSSKVQLLLSDDGGGIDTQKVKKSALKHGLISADNAERLDESAAQALIFLSEVSTSPMITQLSGRGLGLAIVREKAEKLGGQVVVESRPGLGATFRIVIPATRGTFRGILVEAAGRVFVVPTIQVERVMRARSDDMHTVEGRETISFDGRAVALVQLAAVLSLPPVERKNMPSAEVMLILGSGNQRVAFSVDAVLDEQEILVKPLPRPLSRIRNIAAATVLGSGEVVPILHVGDLLKSARKAAVGAAVGMAAAMPPAGARIQSILLAEDSITSRLLLKGILESAGYKVKTAIDGMDAFTLLRAEEFDLLVSDVEMPRLNGFDLTARIRADKKLAELPVVLVTALETREDRERGIDAGANAYIVKGSFDQSNLIEAVRRLV